MKSILFATISAGFIPIVTAGLLLSTKSFANSEKGEFIAGEGAYSFRMYGDTDFFGNDLYQFHSDLNGCKEACADDTACKGFTFNAWTNTCHLKHTMASSNHSWAGISGIKIYERSCNQCAK